jgi:hypothetical protein
MSMRQTLKNVSKAWTYLINFFVLSELVESSANRLLELCSNHFSSRICQPGVLNKDPTVWLDGRPLTISLNMSMTRNTKGGSITVPLTSCLTGLESAV